MIKLTILGNLRQLFIINNLKEIKLYKQENKKKKKDSLNEKSLNKQGNLRMVCIRRSEIPSKINERVQKFYDILIKQRVIITVS